MRYCFSILFCLITCFSSVGHTAFLRDQTKEIEELVKCFPHTSEDVELFVDQTIAELEGAVKPFGISKENESIANTLAKWDQVGKLFFARCCVLYNLGVIYTEPSVDAAAKLGISKVQSFFAKCLKEHKAQETILSYLEKAAVKDEIEISHYPHLKIFFTEEVKLDDFKQLMHLKSKINEVKTAPFTLCKGKSSNKAAAKDPDFSLLSWNICGLPRPLSLLFGGVLPWDMRIDQIIETLQAHDADVVCLQEVFDEAAALRLYDALKEKYSDFCFNIAPRHFGFSPFSVGLSSGLFVASKYPIDNYFWTPFKDSVFPIINRGFFAFKIKNGNDVAHLINTHMESSLDDSNALSRASECRFLQLKQILAYIEQEISTPFPDKPILVCGDLNIYWASQEPAEALIREAFYDSYNQARNGCTFETCTQCDYTGYWWPEYVMNFNRKKYKPVPCILDYVLLFSKIPENTSLKNRFCVQTRRIQIADEKEQHPLNALSDHYPLLTRCSWR